MVKNHTFLTRNHAEVSEDAERRDAINGVRIRAYRVYRQNRDIVFWFLSGKSGKSVFRTPPPSPVLTHTF